MKWTSSDIINLSKPIVVLVEKGLTSMAQAPEGTINISNLRRWMEYIDCERQANTMATDIAVLVICMLVSSLVALLW